MELEQGNDLHFSHKNAAHMLTQAQVPVREESTAIPMLSPVSSISIDSLKLFRFVKKKH